MKISSFPVKGVLIFAAFLCCFGMELRAQSGNIQYEKMIRALQVVRSAYIEQVGDEQLVEDAIRGMLRELDPHSVYLTAEELRQANEPLMGSFDGIGVQFNIIHDTIVVISAVPGGPSERVGILPGDKIITINDTSSVGSQVTNQFVLDRLRGPRGSHVKVGIVRRGSNQVLQFHIRRDRIPINSVDAAFMVAPEIGYIKISRFARTTMLEFLTAISQLEGQGMEHLILDLSFNSGGFLDVAIQLTDQFLEANRLIVYTQGNAAPTQRHFSTSKGTFLKGKLVVIINEGSASASEILAGAIQDWDRGLIVGRRSFGKGLVQQSFNLPDGSAIRLTTARYHTPTGRSIQKPFDEGSDRYFEELTDRLRMGELVSSKNITFPDSLRFTTKINKREVFGGGGIMPDFFIPIDTTQVSEFYARLVRSGALNNFGVEYTNANREQLTRRHQDVGNFLETFKVDEELINQLLAYATREGISPGTGDPAASMGYLNLQLKGLVARNLFGFDAYIQVLAQEDDSIKKAVNLIQSDIFREMNILYR